MALVGYGFVSDMLTKSVLSKRNVNPHCNRYTILTHQYAFDFRIVRFKICIF